MGLVLWNLPAGSRLIKCRQTPPPHSPSKHHHPHHHHHHRCHCHQCHRQHCHRHHCHRHHHPLLKPCHGCMWPHFLDDDADDDDNDDDADDDDNDDDADDEPFWDVTAAEAIPFAST